MSVLSSVSDIVDALLAVPVTSPVTFPLKLPENVVAVTTPV